jgi:hypothetical protein
MVALMVEVETRVTASEMFELLVTDQNTTSAAPETESYALPELPFAVPQSQLYYWSRLWREGIRVSREALESGEYVDFDSDDPSDVLRWLFGDDED